MRKSYRVISGVTIAAVACVITVLLTSRENSGKDQYVVINIADQNFQPAFGEIMRIRVEEDASRTGLGVGGIFSYFDESRQECETHLREFLSLAEQYEIPVIVQIDGEQWWSARPDLWNWWDSGGPGFDPQNRMNVEWFDWSPDSALKIAWRNWGRQIRVLPPPNLMSARYRAACHDEMRALIPVILAWWEGLPARKKHLFLGVKLGWESSIGVNSFYYPDGNSYLGRPESDDPRVELKADAVPDRGVKTIGYASVSTARLASGGTLQEAHLAEVVRRHLEELCALAAGLGVPRERLFTHVGGWKDNELLYDAAVNAYSCPGWSFYRYANDASKDDGVRRAIARSDAPWWAAVEWMVTPDTSPEGWRVALRRTLSIPKCRYVCLYNWDGIRNNKGALDAIQEALRPTTTVARGSRGSGVGKAGWCEGWE